MTGENAPMVEVIDPRFHPAFVLAPDGDLPPSLSETSRTTSIFTLPLIRPGPLIGLTRGAFHPAVNERGVLLIQPIPPVQRPLPLHNPLVDDTLNAVAICVGYATK